MAASLLDIAPPGQPWLPGQPVDYTSVNRAVDRWNAGQPFWRLPAIPVGANPMAARYAQPPPGYDNAGRPIATTSGTGSSGNGSPFSAETLVRNPELAEILKKLYADIGGISTDPTKNQTTLQRNVKLPEVEAAGQAALASQQADANNNAQSIADFTKQFMAEQPAALARANEESGEIGRLYSGEYQRELEANRKKAGILSTQNLLRRLGMISGAGNLADLNRGGVTNSITNANLMREAAGASLARDMEFAGQERADIQNILDRQIGAAGVRQRLIDAVLQRPLTPIQAGQSVAANDVNRLNAISSLLMGNNLFTPQTRSGLVGDVLRLYQGAAGLDPAAYYRYVRGDFPNQLPGVVPQGALSLPNPASFAPGAGGTSFDDLIAALGYGGGAGGQPTLPATLTASGTRQPGTIESLFGSGAAGMPIREAARLQVPAILEAIRRYQGEQGTNPLTDRYFSDQAFEQHLQDAIMGGFSQLIPGQIDSFAGVNRDFSLN